MASEIRVNQIQNRSGLSTVTINDSGLEVSGVVTSTNFSGPVIGNVTGNVTGDVTGDVTANQITVGDKFINSSGVGLGQTTTLGRNAGINTAIGT